MSTASLAVSQRQTTELNGFMHGKEWLGLAGVLAAHAVLLGAILFLGTAKQPELITPPAVIGMLVPPAPPAEVEPPKPVPPTPKPPEPKPVARPKASPPPVKAPPSERAVTAPPAETTAPREDVKPAANDALAPPAAARVAPAAPTPAPAPVIPPRTDAAHLNNPEPAYPAMSRRLGEEGQVLLDVHIQPDGSVGEVKLKRSSGFSRLDEAAIQAVKRWRYIPARRGSEPIAYWYVQPVKFSLNN